MTEKDSSSREAIRAHLEASCEALGYFIAESSMVEVMIHICVQQWLGINAKVARLLVGEPRIGDLVDLAKKAAVLAGYTGERYALIETLASITTESNKIRQIVAHKPMAPQSDGTIMFFNGLTAKSDAAKYKYKCTPAELMNQGELLGECAASWPRMILMEKEDDEVLHAIRVIRKRLASLQSNPLPVIPNPPRPPKPPKPPRQRRASPA